MSIDAGNITPAKGDRGAKTNDLRLAYDVSGGLPDTLPIDPLPVFRSWLDEAIRLEQTPNPNAMSIATVDPDGRPSSRIVLCRGVHVEHGFVVFYTNRESRKGRALAADQRIAGVLHFDHADKQVRIEGRVTESPAAESEAYFAGRGVAKAIAAWASDQSRPIESRQALLDRAHATMRRFGYDPETGQAADQNGQEAGQQPGRPPHWGGYRIWIDAIELWVGNASRLHDRAVWRRELSPGGSVDGAAMMVGGAWEATRLQP